MLSPARSSCAAAAAMLRSRKVQLRWRHEVPTRAHSPAGSASASEAAEVAEQAAAAECSASEFVADLWPDGTPKRFRGREAWKNWIDYDSPFKSQTDELNRMRHYFFHVDDRGRLWRKELHRLEEHDGEVRDSRTLDYFFGHMQVNTTGKYQNLFPFLSRRAHEHYFTSCSAAPVIFNDLREGELRLMCPDGELASSVTTLFEPNLLRLGSEGRLYHPCVTSAIDEVGARPLRVELMAMLESSTAQQVLECCEEQEAADGSSSVLLRWRGEGIVLHPWDPGTARRSSS